MEFLCHFQSLSFKVSGFQSSIPHVGKAGYMEESDRQTCHEMFVNHISSIHQIKHNIKHIYQTNPEILSCQSRVQLTSTLLFSLTGAGQPPAACQPPASRWHQKDLQRHAAAEKLSHNEGAQCLSFLMPKNRKLELGFLCSIVLGVCHIEQIPSGNLT